MATKLVYQDEAGALQAPTITGGTTTDTLTVSGAVTLGSTAGGALALGKGGATNTIGFYGATPVVQRATASTHTTSNCVSSSAFGAQQNAILLEVVNTLLALGVWAA